MSPSLLCPLRYVLVLVLRSRSLNCSFPVINISVQWRSVTFTVHDFLFFFCQAIPSRWLKFDEVRVVVKWTGITFAGGNFLLNASDWRSWSCGYCTLGIGDVLGLNLFRFGLFAWSDCASIEIWYTTLNYAMTSSGYNSYLHGQGLVKNTGWFGWLILPCRQRGAIVRMWLMAPTLNRSLKF